MYCYLHHLQNKISGMLNRFVLTNSLYILIKVRNPQMVKKISTTNGPLCTIP